MKTIIAITHLKLDSQVNLIKKILTSFGASLIKLHTGTIDKSKLSLVEDGDIRLMFKGKFINEPVIWYATHPRTDAAYALNWQFPNEYRLSAQQFISDIENIAFKRWKCFPSNTSFIAGAESKLSLFSDARKIGFKVPQQTINATHIQKNNLSELMLYRKKLGFPVCISFDRESGTEVVSEVTNSLEDGKDVVDGLWQWQTPIASCGQIRCFVHKKLVLAKCWKRVSEIKSLKDMREVGSAQNSTKWYSFSLPDDICRKLKKLLSLKKLIYACPEFLLTAAGEFILIDLNPCGDWIGFFNKKEEKHMIAEIIARSLLA